VAVKPNRQQRIRIAAFLASMMAFSAAEVSGSSQTSKRKNVSREYDVTFIDKLLSDPTAMRWAVGVRDGKKMVLEILCRLWTLTDGLGGQSALQSSLWSRCRVAPEKECVELVIQLFYDTFKNVFDECWVLLPKEELGGIHYVSLFWHGYLSFVSREVGLGGCPRFNHSMGQGTLALEALSNYDWCCEPQLLGPLISYARKCIFEAYSDTRNPDLLLHLVTTKFYRRPNEHDLQLFDEFPLEAFLHNVLTHSTVRAYLEKYPELGKDEYTLDGMLKEIKDAAIKDASDTPGPAARHTTESIANDTTESSDSEGTDCFWSFSDVVDAMLGEKSNFSDDTKRYVCKKIISSVKDMKFEDSQDEATRLMLVLCNKYDRSEARDILECRTEFGHPHSHHSRQTFGHSPYKRPGNDHGEAVLLAAPCSAE
jgi:hypothetical protein